jgi:hypothetical protein
MEWIFYQAAILSHLTLNGVEESGAVFSLLRLNDKSENRLNRSRPSGFLMQSLRSPDMLQP